MNNLGETLGDWGESRSLFWEHGSYDRPKFMPMGYSQVKPSVILISWEYQEKGGNSNEWSYLWRWRALDLDRRNFGVVYSACHRFPRIYLLIGPDETVPCACARKGPLLFEALLSQQGCFLCPAFEHKLHVSPHVQEHIRAIGIC